MLNRRILKATPLFLAGVLATGILVLRAGAQSQVALQDAPPAAPVAAPPPEATAPSRPQPPRLARQAIAYYATVWGVEEPSVKAVESGEIIKFTYRVLDPDKAKVLNDKKLEPSLVDYRAGVKLVVPSLEQVGALRQSSTPIAGKTYWMAFSNSGRRVRRGDRVDVVIGNFQAQGLIVE